MYYNKLEVMSYKYMIRRITTSVESTINRKLNTNSTVISVIIKLYKLHLLTPDLLWPRRKL